MAINNKTTQVLFLAIFGALFSLAYFFRDYLYEKLCIFFLIPYLILGVSLICLFILTIVNKNKAGIVLGSLILSSILLIQSELFKSKIILQATLTDDLSAIHLTLRENQQFELNSSTLFTEDYFYGKYKLVNDKIIFLDKRYSNDFIPDTVTVIGDKVIIKFENGKPVTDFATYFDINRNEIKRKHVNSNSFGM